LPTLGASAAVFGQVYGVVPTNGLSPSRTSARPVASVPGSQASYSLEKRVSRHPETFGHGAIEGVAGPESANNAAAQTSFVALLTLGLPAHPVMALMLGAFIIQGITPGPNVIVDEPALFWGLVVSMWVGNLMLVLLNLPLIGIWVKLLTIPYNVLFPAIEAFACIGTYSLNLNAFDIYAIAFFGILGYFLIKVGCEPAPLLLGFILGPLLEQHLRRAMIISHGDPTVFLTRPISLALLVAAALALAITVLPSIRTKRRWSSWRSRSEQASRHLVVDMALVTSVILLRSRPYGDAGTQV
jgi:putative tricarboxylic transport membrane protein